MVKKGVNTNNAANTEVVAGTENTGAENTGAENTAGTDTANTAAVLSTSITCPHCQGIITIERPAAQRRGQLTGLDIADMTDAQLKIEKINSGSVLYKAIKRGASAETVGKNQARFDAVKAEIEKRAAAKAPVATATTEAAATTEVAPVESTETDPNVAAQM